MSVGNSDKEQDSTKKFKKKQLRRKNDVVQHVPLQDEVVVDLVLQKLFNNGNKQTASLADDVFMPLNIEFTEAGFNRIWDVLISTNLVAPVIGFGRSGKLAITKEGFQLMNQFGSYINFIKLREAAKQQTAVSNAPTTKTVNIDKIEEDKSPEVQPDKEKSPTQSDDSNLYKE